MFIQIQGPTSTTWKKLLLLGCITTLLGIFAITAPISLAHVFMMLIGALICSIGITNFISRLRKNTSDGMRFDSTGFASAIFALVGALIMLAPEGASSFVVGIIALCLLLLGGLFFIICVSTACGAVSTISSGLICLAGAFFFINRDIGIIYFMGMCGISFMIIGISLIAAAFSLKKRLELFEAAKSNFEGALPPLMKDFFKQVHGNKTWYRNSPHNKNSNDIFRATENADECIEVQNLADNDSKTGNGRS